MYHKRNTNKTQTKHEPRKGRCPWLRRCGCRARALEFPQLTPIFYFFKPLFSTFVYRPLSVAAPTRLPHPRRPRRPLRPARAASSGGGTRAPLGARPSAARARTAGASAAGSRPGSAPTTFAVMNEGACHRNPFLFFSGLFLVCVCVCVLRFGAVQVAKEGQERKG